MEKALGQGVPLSAPVPSPMGVPQGSLKMEGFRDWPTG